MDNLSHEIVRFVKNAGETNSNEICKHFSGRFSENTIIDSIYAIGSNKAGEEYLLYHVNNISDTPHFDIVSLNQGGIDYFD